MNNCSHPNRLRGTDGVMRCLTCGQAVEAASPAPAGKPSPKAAGAEKPKRTRKKAE